MSQAIRDNLKRLLAPRHLAFVGGRSMARALKRCAEGGYPGQMWLVNPQQDSIDGVPCVRSVAELPCAPINTIDKIVNDPQIKAREMIVEVEHPVAGHLKMAGLPVKMSATPGAIERPAPLLGQHTAELLKEILGWDEAKTAKFFGEE